MESLGCCHCSCVQPSFGHSHALFVQDNCLGQGANHRAPVGAHPEILHQSAHQVLGLALPAGIKEVLWICITPPFGLFQPAQQAPVVDAAAATYKALV